MTKIMSITNHLSRRFFIGLVALSVFCYLFVVSGNPISAITYAGHDDALFFKHLESILSGKWLGQYDNLTLAKGPMLSLIGAFSAVFGVTAKIAEAIICLIAASSIVFVARRIGLQFAAAVALFIFILFNPYLYSSGNRYLRDYLYSAFAILTVALTMGAISPLNKRAGGWFAAGMGFFAGCAFLTREEDIWLIATLVTLFLVAALIAIARMGLLGVLEKWRIVILRTIIASGALMAIVFPVMLANYLAYGNAIVSEFRSSEFRAAMGALARVGDIHPSGYVPVPQSSLEQVFNVAPVTAGMKEHWQRISRVWSGAGANLIPAYPNEVAGGWFAWAFRDAAAAAGHHSSASAARDFYAQLANEVNAACDEGTLSCRRKRASLAPELTVERLPSLIAASWNALLYTVSMKGGQVKPARSQGETATLMRWNQLIGPVVVDPSGQLLISGWVANMNGNQPYITLTETSIGILDLSTGTGDDVVAHFEAQGIKGIVAVRFSMIVKCVSDDCAISVESADGERQTIPLDKLVQGQTGPITLNPPFVGHFDVVNQNMQTTLSARPLENIRLAIASSAVKFAQVAVPILVNSASIGMLLYLMRWRQHQRCDWLFVLAAGAATAVIVRSVIIAYINITSWRAINVGYLGPAYGFVIIYSIVGTSILVSILSDQLRNFLNRPAA
jgi:hypothetical protein